MEERRVRALPSGERERECERADFPPLWWLRPPSRGWRYPASSSSLSLLSLEYSRLPRERDRSPLWARLRRLARVVESVMVVVVGVSPVEVV